MANGGCQGLEAGLQGVNRPEVSVWEDETVLEMDGGDGWSAVRKCLMPLPCTLGNGRSGRL